jgi:hypothetical protein
MTRPARLHQLPRPWLEALLAPAAGLCAPPRSDAADIDWTGIAADASSHAIGVLIWNRLRELGTSAVLPEAVQHAWDADDQHARLQTVLQKRDAHEISAALDDAGVAHAFLKGAAYRDWLYTPSWCRVGADLDILVERHEIERARAALHAIGFSHASSTIDYRNFRAVSAAQIAEVENEHYELAQLERTARLTNVPAWLFGDAFVRRPPFTFERHDDGIDFHTVVDVHWTVHFTFAKESLLRDVVREAGSLPRLSTGWNIVITAFKLYYEAFDRPYYGFHHVADLAAMLRTWPASADWQLVDDLVQRHGLWAPLYYTLAAASSIAGDAAAPRDLLAAWSRTAPPPETFAPGAERTSWFTHGDCGDFVPYMIGQRIGTALGTSSPGTPSAAQSSTGLLHEVQQ